MKWEVKLYVGGKVFTEEVYASSHRDARETATARNPRAKVIGVNPIIGVDVKKEPVVEVAQYRLCGPCFRVFYKSQRISTNATHFQRWQHGC